MPEMLTASMYMQNLILYFIGVLLLPIVQMLNCLNVPWLFLSAFQSQVFCWLSFSILNIPVLILEWYCNTNTCFACLYFR